VPGGQHPDAAGQLGRHVRHGDAVSCQAGSERSAEAGRSFDTAAVLRNLSLRVVALVA